MKYRIFLLESRIPFLMKEIPEGKVQVVEVDEDKMATVDITIEDAFDLLKVFHAGLAAAGEK